MSASTHILGIQGERHSQEACTWWELTRESCPCGGPAVFPGAFPAALRRRRAIILFSLQPVLWEKVHLTSLSLSLALCHWIFPFVRSKRLPLPHLRDLGWAVRTSSAPGRDTKAFCPGALLLVILSCCLDFPLHAV